MTGGIDGEQIVGEYEDVLRVVEGIFVKLKH